MINIKNILKVLLVTMFVCAYSNNVWAQNIQQIGEYITMKGTEEERAQYNASVQEAKMRYNSSRAGIKKRNELVVSQNPEIAKMVKNNKSYIDYDRDHINKMVGDIKSYVANKGTEEEKAQLARVLEEHSGNEYAIIRLYTNYNPELLSKMKSEYVTDQSQGYYDSLQSVMYQGEYQLWSKDGVCDPACVSPEVCEYQVADSSYKCVKKEQKAEEPTDDDGMGGNDQVESIDFCSGNLGIFEDLVKTGQRIFNRLRDLIYVVAGFGIIAVAVGGFFGNLNWKWLGAIVISLVVIATAGELIVLLTGCETFNGALITNTLTSPAPMEDFDAKDSGYLVNMSSQSDGQ